MGKLSVIATIVLLCSQFLVDATPTVDALKDHCKKYVAEQHHSRPGQMITVLCERILNAEAMDSEQHPEKRGYDFIRYGKRGYDFIRYGKRQANEKKSDAANSKKSDSYDYIRFG